MSKKNEKVTPYSNNLNLPDTPLDSPPPPRIQPQRGHAYATTYILTLKNSQWSPAKRCSGDTNSMLALWY